MANPKIGISMGDPKGIGPEIIARAFPILSRKFQLTIFGDPKILEKACRLVRCSPKALLKATEACSHLSVPPKGLSAREAGAASMSYVRAVTKATQAGSIQALVTAPICKEHVHAAGFRFPGHTEYLAHLTRTKKFTMMLAGTKLKVVLVTIHEPLSHVPSLLTSRKIFTTIQLTHIALRQWFGKQRPRIAVAGLNPHAGENGAFGKEEIQIIKPALRRAQKTNIAVSGPLSPDTVFVRAVRGEFDAVVCMYHDQGLIPLKLLHFEEGVNITLGLPLIRTSVDHGTAFDIAWKGRANPRSLIAAVETAGKMVLHAY